jgi:hypothetical protein
MRVLGAALVVVLGGCSTTTQPEGTAEREWEALALPILQADCVVCHATPGPLGFLAGDTPLAIRMSLLEYQPPIVDLGAPASSRLLTKGAHDGPALSAQETSDLLEWITVERDEAGVPPRSKLSTGAFTVLACIGGTAGDPTCPYNEVDLAAIGVAATIRFVATPSAGRLTISQLALAADALRIELVHPRFVAHPANGPAVPDPADSLAGVDVTTSGPIGSGTVLLVGDAFTSSPLSIDFDAP